MARRSIAIGLAAVLALAVGLTTGLLIGRTEDPTLVFKMERPLTPYSAEVYADLIRHFGHKCAKVVRRVYRSEEGQSGPVDLFYCTKDDNTEDKEQLIYFNFIEDASFFFP